MVVLTRVSISLKQPLFPSGLQLGDLGLEGSKQFPSFLLVFCSRAKVGTHFARQRRIDVQFVGTVEEGVELVELFLADRVVLVVVATGAADRQAQPDRTEGAGTIDGLLGTELLEVSAALPVAEGVSMKPGRDLLLDGRVRQKVARGLLDRELIEWHITVQHLDDPMAIAPCVRSELVRLITVAVGVSCQVEPVARPLLPVVRRVKQAIDELFVGFRAIIRQEFGHFLGGWRKANQVEVRSPNQGGRVGLTGRLNPLSIETSQDKPIDRVPDPVMVSDRRQRAPSRGNEGPVITLLGCLLTVGDLGLLDRDDCVFLPLRTLIDPSPQQTDLHGAQPLAHRRHDEAFFEARSLHTGDEQDELACSAVTRLDYRSRVAALRRPLRAV